MEDLNLLQSWKEQLSTFAMETPLLDNDQIDSFDISQVLETKKEMSKKNLTKS
jgi:hypothetical protein